MQIRWLKRLFHDPIESQESPTHKIEAGTFQWMLEDPEDIGLWSRMTVAPQYFISWHFWQWSIHISGRAGTGKSTLMTFLRYEPRTRFELERWEGEKKLVFSGFYVCNSGTRMQVSLDGLHGPILFEVSRQGHG